MVASDIGVFSSSRPAFIGPPTIAGRTLRGSASRLAPTHVDRLFRSDTHRFPSVTASSLQLTSTVNPTSSRFEIRARCITRSFFFVLIKGNLSSRPIRDVELAFDGRIGSRVFYSFLLCLTFFILPLFLSLTAAWFLPRILTTLLRWSLPSQKRFLLVFVLRR